MSLKDKIEVMLSIDSHNTHTSLLCDYFIDDYDSWKECADIEDETYQYLYDNGICVRLCKFSCYNAIYEFSDGIEKVRMTVSHNKSNIFH